MNGSKKRKMLILALSLILLFCSGMYAYQVYQQHMSSKIYEEAQKLASVEPTPSPEPTSEPEPTPEPEPVETVNPYLELFTEIDLPALKEVNQGVIGWILIPDTPISYPLMYSGENVYYLSHTWDKKYNAAGSIFLEQYNAPDLSDFNTIIYGHRMNNGSMFGSLKRYKEPDYWSEHPYVYIYNEAGAFRYEIFAAYEASVTGDTYRLGLTETEDRQSFLDACLGWSVLETGIVPTVDDQIITLSTCTGTGYDSRWVVQAKYTPEE